ncbi:TetR/AcrR family transcriptional regulator [Sphingomonas flavalba]|uniref:TetR/AcrR family transcriptional regulator n=1 Tax=Sphingomonas flavalba TaxID=2559804 RepID=UPI0039E1935F
MTDNVTKVRILDEANSLIRELGMNGISYAHISSRVNIRKASIHYYFPTKDDLIRELVAYQSQIFLDDVRAIVEDGGADARTKMRRYFGLFEKAFNDGKGGSICLFGMLGAEIHSLDDKTCDIVRDFYSRNIQSIRTILAAPDTDEDTIDNTAAVETAHMIFSAIEGAMIISRANRDLGGYKAVMNNLLNIIDFSK